MINTIYFPSGYGMYYNAPLKENADKTITVGDFNFALAGKTYAIKGNTFNLDVGDTVYITANGLKQYKEKEYPEMADLFPNNSAHWLIKRTGEDAFNALEVQ